jgi:hypothetical protein
MNAIVKFGDWFTWEAHDDYVNEAINDSPDIAVVINAILSDEAKMKQHNFKDHEKARAKSHGTKHMDQGHWSRHHGGQDKDHDPGHKKPCDHDRGQ